MRLSKEHLKLLYVLLAKILLTNLTSQLMFRHIKIFLFGLKTFGVRSCVLKIKYGSLSHYLGLIYIISPKNILSNLVLY